MFLAEKTVKNYVSSLLAKLGLERRTQAAVLATRLLGERQLTGRRPRQPRSSGTAPAQRRAGAGRPAGSSNVAADGRCGALAQVDQAAAGGGRVAPTPLSVTVDA